MKYFILKRRWELWRLTSTLLGRVAVSAVLAYGCAHVATYTLEKITAL